MICEDLLQNLRVCLINNIFINCENIGHYFTSEPIAVSFFKKNLYFLFIFCLLIEVIYTYCGCKKFEIVEILIYEEKIKSTTILLLKDNFDH